MPHATMPSPGLQALILCGPGSSLSTFTSNPKDLPKAIIPIANRPMVWYPLDWCYRMGVTDITLITPSEASQPLEAAVATNPSLTSLPSPKPEILAPADLTQVTGTTELLRLPEVQASITGDFIILPCDLVSELEGSKLLQQWMTLNTLSTSSSSVKKGGLTMFYPTYGLESISTKKDETDFLATILLPVSPVPPPPGSLRSNIEQIVLNMPTDTLNDKLEESKGFLRLRQSLLRKHGRVSMRMKYRDAGVYVFPYWVKDFVKLEGTEGFESVSEDLAGWWGRCGWQNGLAEKLGLDEVLSDGNVDRGEDVEANGDGEEEVVDLAGLVSTKSSRRPLRQDGPGFASRVGISTPPSNEPTQIPPLLAYVQPSYQPQSLIRRTDTSNQLLSVSLYLAKQPATHSLAHEHKVHPTAQLEQQARVAQEDCLVAENVKIGFRSNIKESVIGANCEIGQNVRMTKCLLMEGVVVGDGVQLSGCVIGRRAKIEGMKAIEAGVVGGESEGKKGGKKKGADGDGEEEKTKLTDCEVAPGFVVEAGTEAKGEKFMGFDTDEFDDGGDEFEGDGGDED